jgi:hypothetical protein
VFFPVPPRFSTSLQYLMPLYQEQPLFSGAWTRWDLERKKSSHVRRYSLSQNFLTQSEETVQNSLISYQVSEEHIASVFRVDPGNHIQNYIGLTTRKTETDMILSGYAFRAERFPQTSLALTASTKLIWQKVLVFRYAVLVYHQLFMKWLCSWWHYRVANCAVLVPTENTKR